MMCRISEGLASPLALTTLKMKSRSDVRSWLVGTACSQGLLALASLGDVVEGPVEDNGFVLTLRKCIMQSN